MSQALKQYHDDNAQSWLRQPPPSLRQIEVYSTCFSLNANPVPGVVVPDRTALIYTLEILCICLHWRGETFITLPATVHEQEE